MDKDPWQQSISWQRLLREVFAAWWQRALVWVGMGALSFLVTLGMSSLLDLLKTGMFRWLALAAIPFIDTLVVLLFFHLALRYIFGKEVYRSGFGSALRIFIPVLLLQLIGFIISQIFIYFALSWAVQVHGVWGSWYFSPSVLFTMTIVLEFINLLLVPFTFLVGPIMLVERVWPLKAIARSWSLMSGRVSHFIILVMLLYLPMMLFALALLVLPPINYMTWSLTVNIISDILVSPWFVLTSVIMYHDLLQLIYRHPCEVVEWAVEPIQPTENNVSS